MRHTLIEAAHLIAGLLAVLIVSETAAWAYPLGHVPIRWIGRIVAVAVVVWSLPRFAAAWRSDRAHG